MPSTEGMIVVKDMDRSMLDTIAFCALGEIASHIDRQKTFVVTDRKIFSLFGTSFPDCPIAFVPEGESAKSWEVLVDLYGQLIASKLDRSWSLLAIGGGTVSDIAGFAAHTWMRGIGFLTAPTTLLAMTDASIGGKNGIDFKGFKNVVGSFHLPSAIFCDVDTLRTLDATQFASGMAEVIKHAIIDGEEYFSFLEASIAQGGESGLDYVSCPAQLLRHMVCVSQRIKLGIVERDPWEAGERRILNLGHSLGHAIEIASGLPHGHAISLGIALASSFSMRKGRMKPNTAKRISGLLSGYGLPVDYASLVKPIGAEVIAALFMDKKREDGWMNFVIPGDIGDVVVEKIAIAELTAFLDEVLL
jgi:3-dehydroquinate synthase